MRRQTHQKNVGIQTHRMCFSLLACCAVAVIAGCQSGDHRMSVDDFLMEQQEAKAEEMTPLSEEEAVELQELVDSQFGPFVVGPGDILAVTVTGPDPETLLPTVQARVDRKGEIQLPMVGAVDVAAMELEDVDDAVLAAFVPDVMRDASVFVELVKEGTTEVLVKGAVEIPGLIPLKRTQRNMLYAIVLAGGVTNDASGTATLRRIRNPSEEVEIDLTNPAGMHEALAQKPLERGDIITVDAAMPNAVFVGGLVKINRPQEYPAGVRMTVLQALAGAGGLRSDVTPREATLIRHLPDGSDRFVKLDLDAIYAGEDENLLLAAGDVLHVPETLETRVQDFINRNLFFRAGVSVNYSISGVEFMNRQDQQSNGGTSDLQDQFDPFGFLNRNSSINSLVDRPVP